jgi:hypothetical protein
MRWPKTYDLNRQDIREAKMRWDALSRFFSKRGSWPPDSDQEVNRAIAVGTPAPTFCSRRIERPNHFLRWAASREWASE